MNCTMAYHSFSVLSIKLLPIPTSENPSRYMFRLSYNLHGEVTSDKNVCFLHWQSHILGAVSFYGWCDRCSERKCCRGYGGQLCLRSGPLRPKFPI